MKRLITILAILSLSPITINPSWVKAHEGRDSGNIRLTVGWLEEPAFEGLRNGISLRVIEQETLSQQSDDRREDHSQHESHGLEQQSDDNHKDQLQHFTDSHNNQAQHESHGSEQQPDGDRNNIDTKAHGTLFVSPA